MSIDRVAHLKALHLYGMASALLELQAEASRQPARPEVWLDRLIEAEQADRQVRSLRYQLKAPASRFIATSAVSTGKKPRSIAGRSSNWPAAPSWTARIT